VGLPGQRTLRSLLGHADEQLKLIDPLEMNLLVAREIPSLGSLNIAAYKQAADKYANDIKRGLRDAEREFHKTPWDWKNDLHFFRLGYLCWYVDVQLGIRYREDQKDLTAVSYTNPNDLFLNGVLDTRRGTCANMAALHVALGWRLRWPVSLACVGSHLICRYDDGTVTHNIEATKTGQGGFHSHPDHYYLEAYRLPLKAVRCGSDLRALAPREVLGEFVGLRGRHYDDTGRPDLAESDYLLARCLFPRSRHLHYVQLMASVQGGMDLFEPGERGHPVELANLLQEVVRLAPWERRGSTDQTEVNHAGARDKVFKYDWSGKIG
jgi:hypothetical protein